MISCDLCGQAKDCLQKEIDGKEFDICGECWSAFVEKLKGKGRVKKARDIILLLPPTVPERKPEEPQPTPGLPPKIFGGAERAN